MPIFEKFMFVALPRKESKRVTSTEGKSVDEVDKASSTEKERAIVVFLYVLIGSFALSLLLYFVMLLFELPGAEKVSKVFSYLSTTLIGYFLGTNKGKA